MRGLSQTFNDTSLAKRISKMSWLGDVSQAPELLASGYFHQFGQKNSKPLSAKYTKQVHGVSIADANTVTQATESQHSAADHEIEADGLFCQQSGQVITVRTADCLPVLFGGMGRSPVVCAVHAGWRGLTAGILRQTVDLLIGLEVNLSSVRVAIGPAISSGNFEVGPEVLEAFKSSTLGLTSDELLHVASKGRADRWHIDSQTAAALSLCNLGVAPENIEVLRVCTFKTTGLNSYRREGKGVSSNWTWIQCP